MNGIFPSFINNCFDKQSLRARFADNIAPRRKVDANFINEKYHGFLLKNKAEGEKDGEHSAPRPKRPPAAILKLLKREEARKRGIFVEADDKENDYSFMEKPSAESRPYICKKRNRKLRWKKKRPSVQYRKAMKEDDTQKSSIRKDVSLSEKKTQRSDYALISGSTSVEKVPAETGNADQPLVEDNTQPDDEVAIQTSDAIPPQSLVSTTPNIEGNASHDTAQTGARKESTEKTEGRSDTVTFNPSSKQLEMKTETHKEDDVFAKIDEDEDLEKVLADFDAGNVAGVGASDKRSINAARKILKLAYKEKAMEKVLTKEENKIISKFFAGKLPYDENVLKTMDQALDKTIDYMQTHGTHFDEETQRFINNRQTLKAAMLETMLTTPKFIPKNWVKEYDRFHKEALRKTEGINWAKIILFYPRQRSFDDGEADIYGNFTRNLHSTHWIVGCILGPSDYKSFEETEREKQAKCLFMDTAVMESARKIKKKTNKNDTTVENVTVDETSQFNATEAASIGTSAKEAPSANEAPSLPEGSKDSNDAPRAPSKSQPTGSDDLPLAVVTAAPPKAAGAVDAPNAQPVSGDQLPVAVDSAPSNAPKAPKEASGPPPPASGGELPLAVDPNTAEAAKPPSAPSQPVGGNELPIAVESAAPPNVGEAAKAPGEAHHAADGDMPPLAVDAGPSAQEANKEKKLPVAVEPM